MHAIQARNILSTKDPERARIKAERSHAQARLADQEYLAAVDRLSEIHSAWQSDMSTACNVNFASY